MDENREWRSNGGTPCSYCWCCCAGLEGETPVGGPEDVNSTPVGGPEDVTTEPPPESQPEEVEKPPTEPGKWEKCQQQPKCMCVTLSRRYRAC